MAEAIRSFETGRGYRASAGYDADAWADRARITPETLDVAEVVGGLVAEHGGLPVGELDDAQFTAVAGALLEGTTPYTTE